MTQKPISLLLVNALILIIHVFGVANFITFWMRDGAIGLLPFIWFILAMILIVCCFGVYSLKSWALWGALIVSGVLLFASFCSIILTQQRADIDFWIGVIMYGAYIWVNMKYIRDNNIKFMWGKK